MRRLVLLASVLPVLLAVMIAAPSASASGSKLFVAPGTTHSADSSCTAAGYNTIQSAVTPPTRGTRSSCVRARIRSK